MRVTVREDGLWRFLRCWGDWSQRWGGQGADRGVIDRHDRCSFARGFRREPNACSMASTVCHLLEASSNGPM